MKPSRKAVTLPNGDEFEFFSPPITLAQRARAQKLAGNDSATDFALQLLVMIAQDENGQKLFAPGEVAELRNELLAELIVAKELHMTLGQLREAMTEAELWLWHAFFMVQREEQEKAMEETRRKRR